MFSSRYLGAGRLTIADQYYNLSYQKTIIIIIFPTRPAAWPPFSVHQGIAPSIFPFYNMKLRYENVEYSEEEAMLKRSTATTLALSPTTGGSGAASRIRKQSDRARTLFYCYTYA